MAFKYRSTLVCKLSISHCALVGTKSLCTKPNITTVPKENKEIVVVGDTLTAVGIAQLGIQSAHKVTLWNPSKQTTGPVRQRILESLKLVAQKQFKTQPRVADKFVCEAMSRLHIVSSPNEAIETADFVIEALHDGDNLYKSLRLRRQYLKEWASIAPPHTIFAFMINVNHFKYFHIINNIAWAVPSRRNSVIGHYFFAPIRLKKLVELVKVRGTSADSLEKARSLSKGMGIMPVVVNNPGELVRSLSLMNNLIHKVEQGRISVSGIDIVTKIGLVNHTVLWLLWKISPKLANLAQLFMVSTTNFSQKPMGPFEMADYIGLDKAKLIIDEINTKDCGEDKLTKKKQSQLLNLLLSEGKLGRKTGEGFYVYNKIVDSERTIVLDKSRESYL